MRTSITDLFDIRYPILNAGMGRVALPVRPNRRAR